MFIMALSLGLTSLAFAQDFNLEVGEIITHRGATISCNAVSHYPRVECNATVIKVKPDWNGGLNYNVPEYYNQNFSNIRQAIDAALSTVTNLRACRRVECTRQNLDPVRNNDNIVVIYPSQSQFSTATDAELYLARMREAGLCR